MCVRLGSGAGVSTTPVNCQKMKEIVRIRHCFRQKNKYIFSIVTLIQVYRGVEPQCHSTKFELSEFLIKTICSKYSFQENLRTLFQSAEFIQVNTKKYNFFRFFPPFFYLLFLISWTVNRTVNKMYQSPLKKFL